MTTPSAWEELGKLFDGLSGLLSGGKAPHTDVVVRASAAAMSTPVEAGLTVVHNRAKPHSTAVTSEVVTVVDDLQHAAGQGPCMEALSATELVHSPDLTSETRWPDFAPACVARTSVRSVLSVRLVMARDSLASLTFYAPTAGAFRVADERVAVLVAPFAAMALQGRLDQDRMEHLETALVSSRRIGTAIGIVMAREQLTSEQAFQRLVHASQHLNRKLRDVAEQVELTGELPQRR